MEGANDATVAAAVYSRLTGVKSGSTPVGGLVKSGRKQTKEKGRGLDKGLVQPELRPIGFNDKGVER